MKNLRVLFAFLILAGLASCEKDNPGDKSYLSFLNNKAVTEIHILGDSVFVLTSRPCSDCDVPMHMSYRPVITEWTMINGQTYKNYSLNDFPGIPVSDKKGKLYTGKGNTIFKHTGSRYEPLFSTGDYKFNAFTFDYDDNIWLWGESSGIAFWNKSELKIYNSQNSPFLTKIIHGLAIDQTGSVWVTLDFKGLIKITGEQWEVVPNEQIPGLNKYSYLRGPGMVTENSIWFDVFSPDTTSNVLRYTNNSWVYEFPDSGYFSHFKMDSRGTIWAISHHRDNSVYTKSTLKYFENNKWINFDVSDISSWITTVNATNNKVYIGTLEGLVEKSR